MLIQPHGGLLKNNFCKTIPKIQFTISVWENIESDIYNLWNWVYSPLDWFMWKSDMLSVLNYMKLEDWTVWSIPIILDISQEEKNIIEKEKKSIIGLQSNKSWEVIASLEVGEIYSFDKSEFAQKVYTTKDKQHPGVQMVFEMQDYLISGKITLHKELRFDDYCQPYWLTPKNLREEFISKGWSKIVAFQTRNPPHRSHEYLQKCALENCDGLLIHPVIGKKKTGDFNDDYILGAYEVLTEKYYKADTTLLSVLPITMRYAWPREAILHAIIRQNFWCSHMVVWRDHAGVGDYYGTYDAQNIFDNFSKDELQIEILKYEHAGYCSICEEVTSNKTCPHGAEYKLFISGTKIREKIKNKEPMPNEFIRKEVLDFLEDWETQFVD